MTEIAIDGISYNAIQIDPLDRVFEHPWFLTADQVARNVLAPARTELGLFLSVGLT
jgi:hypothetical protein